MYLLLSTPVNQYKMLWILCALAIYCSSFKLENCVGGCCWSYNHPSILYIMYPDRCDLKIVCIGYKNITLATHAHISELMHIGEIPDYKCQAPFPE